MRVRNAEDTAGPRAESAYHQLAVVGLSNAPPEDEEIRPFCLQLRFVSRRPCGEL
jgi:hypothetical protein